MHNTKVSYFDNGNIKSRTDFYQDSIISIFYNLNGKIKRKVVENYQSDDLVFKKVFTDEMDSLIQLVRLNDGLYHENQKLIIQAGKPIKSGTFFKLIQADTIFKDNFSHFFIEYYVPFQSNIIERIVTIDILKKSCNDQIIEEKISPIIKDSIKYVFHLQTDKDTKKNCLEAVINDQSYTSESDSVRITNKKMFVQESLTIDIH